MRNTVAKEVFNWCTTNPQGFLLAGDAGFGVWDDFQKELPDQYLNPGINEAATIGMAAGLALSGEKVFVYNIIPFLLMRCYEQVRVDICYQNLPVVLIGIGSGITYAPAGMTHYAVEDIGLARTLPNLTIISPSDPVQARKAIHHAFQSASPTYIRISKAGEPALFDESIDITQPIVLKSHQSKIALLAHGSILDATLEAYETLLGQGVEVDIISLPMLHPLDEKALGNLLSSYDRIFLHEEHFGHCGLFSILSEYFSRNVISIPLYSLGIKGEYIHAVGNRDHVRKHYGIDAQSVVQTMLETLKAQ